MRYRLIYMTLAISWFFMIPLSAGERIDYVRQVKPILSKNCFGCHGPLQQRGRLRLDTAQSMKSGGDSGPAIVAGKSGDSLLVEYINGNDDFRMPPAEEGKKLDADHIALIEKWIDQGAPSPADERPLPSPADHWAFRPSVRPEVPVVNGSYEIANPIDAFIQLRRERLDLVPQAEAAPEVLLRRVYLDLTGVPPTRGELKAFLANDSPDAYLKVVDRLLSSPLYGQRWGRHWMDIWRYSDWYGKNGQDIINSRQHIWKWRDWIIESLNDDKPYDQMVMEMLAGDELAPGDPEVLRATGYLARSYFHFDRNIQMQNTLEHAGKALLGLTMECARCHDHKYDPISQRDYYRFRAFFEPLGVRQDHVPGEADLDQKSLPRVYDAEPDVQTFVFERGDIRKPVEDDPVETGVPEFFKADIDPVAIALPPQSYYPGLKSYVQRDTLAGYEAEIEQLEADHPRIVSIREKAQQKLEKLQAAVAESSGETSDADIQDAKRSVLKARQAIELNEQKTRTARLKLAEVRACIAADELKYAVEQQRDESRFRELAVSAYRARSAAVVGEAEQAVLVARQRFEDEEASGRNNEVILKLRRDAIKREEDKLAKAKEALAKANGPDAPSDYEPFLPIYPDKSTGRRLSLARWIADGKNPLTARVAVNHVWARHFGRPIVQSVFDFGMAGDAPTHPELLDWLAVEFVESGWSMKRLHRLIVTSRAYRMSSSNREAAPENLARDPDNHFLWKMNPGRMESEVVRDSILHLAGQLDPEAGGPEIDTILSNKVRRRSVYFRHTGEDRLALSEMFDGANVNECYRREVTIIPQQALALANGPLSLEQSCAIARRLSPDHEENETFIAAAFEHVLNRKPKAKETEACLRFLNEQQRLLAGGKELVRFNAASLGVAPSDDPQMRAREDLIHVLFNHNDFVTIR